MKKISLFLAMILFVCTANQVKAQKDERTISTRIADILAQLPANNEADLTTAMKEMEGLKEDGLMLLVQRLAPSEQADNSKLEYAIMGYTGYVSDEGREELRKTAEHAWCKSLSKLENKNNISFLMSMLEIIGTDDAISFVTPFLADDMLSRKAASTLASIGTKKAGEALANALSVTSGSKTAILQALGKMSFSGNLQEIESFAKTGDQQEKEAALYALAEIASPSSAKILLNETSSKNGKFTNHRATALYAIYIRNLNENGNSQLSRKLAADFYKKAAKSDVYARTAALHLVVNQQKENALNHLLKAATDKDMEYRNAALQLFSPYLNADNAKLFVKKLKKASPEVQADIIRFLGENKSATSMDVISTYATSNQPEVKNAAITALAQTGGATATPQLLAILKNTDNPDEKVFEQAFTLINEPNVTKALAAELPAMNEKQKVILLNILSDKRDRESFSTVAQEISNSSDAVKKAALKALPKVSGEKSLPQLFDMLQSASGADEIAVIQDAIITALQEVKTNRERESLVLDKMKEGAQNKHYLYFPILSSIGSTNTLDVIYKAYQNSDGEAQKKAFDALTSWPNINAMDVLYSIASGDSEDDQKDAALKGYISLIKKADVPQEQKLLLLKKAMEAAQTAPQKNLILAETASITTFPALAFAAKYLDDKALQQNAAAAVMNIGLSDKSFYGTLVREWLVKAMNALDGPDAIYMKKSIQKFLDDMPQKEGYVSLFNGKDLSGWKGLVGNPISRSKMNESQLKEAQKKADEVMRNGWIVENGELIFTGKGDNIATLKKYGDIEMHLDWKIFDEGNKEGDAGIYLRGTPQVQIWDTSRVKVGAQVGSGGLYNNQKYESKPLKVADNKLDEWNHFYIKMVGDKVTVYLNGELVTDNVPLENYWDRKMPLFPEEQIELQAHGSRIGYRDIYIKELPRTEAFELSDEEKKEGFEVLFDGTNMDEWTGNTTDYVIEDGVMVVRPQPGSRGNLYSKKEYGDFVFRFEFKLTPGANNGLGIRAPLTGDAAYTGMELQILDNDADIYKNLEKYQYHGSVYGVIPAKRGYLKPVGEWNYQEVIVKGPKIKVILNGNVILDGDLTDARKNGTLDKKDHPGIFREKGHLGFLGHGSVVYFRNIRVKEL